MKPQNNNLHIWEKVEVTNDQWLKEVNTGGRKFKSVNPQKQLRQATELFGPYGSTWGLKDIKKSFMDFENGTKLMFIDCVFFYPDGSFQITNEIKIAYMTTPRPPKTPYLVVDDEASKKLETNTISKALSKLGFSSDVFEGNFEKDGYEKMVSYLHTLDKAEIEAAKKAIKSQTEFMKLVALWNAKKNWHDCKELVEFYKEELSTLQQLDNQQ